MRSSFKPSEGEKAAAKKTKEQKAAETARAEAEEALQDEVDFWLEEPEEETNIRPGSYRDDTTRRGSDMRAGGWLSAPGSG